MKYLKFTQYIYLVAAVLFMARAIGDWSDKREQAYIYIGVAVVAIFMFFFRRKFTKKFEARNRQP
jgi:hypothetical protein